MRQYRVLERWMIRTWTRVDNFQNGPYIISPFLPAPSVRHNVHRIEHWRIPHEDVPVQEDAGTRDDQTISESQLVLRHIGNTNRD